MKVVIVTDGPYGDRAYETIKKEFETRFIELPHPTSTFIEELEIPKTDMEIIEGANILITYTTHPDITTILIERFHDEVDWVIVAAWKGEGFKNQFKSYSNVIFPNIMCELEETGDPTFDEFVSHIGKPEVEVEIEKGKIKEINVVRCAPCGSTTFVADFLKEKYGDQEADLEDLPREAGLRLQNYPCRATKIRLFAPESEKDEAPILHRDAFQEAIEDKKADIKVKKEN
jgi:hypothetical protein